MERPLRLVDFALLAAQFEVAGEAIDRAAEATGMDRAAADADVSGGEVAPSRSEGEPREIESVDESDEEWLNFGVEVEGAYLGYSVAEEEDEFVLIIQAWLTEPTAPYNVHLVVGARFEIPDPPVTRDEAASTLLFMAYPYLRETIYNLTGRSPYQPFQLPPLTRLPHPRVRGENDEPIE